MEIHTNAAYTANNIMKFRTKTTYQGLKATIKRLEAHIDSSGAKRTGELIVAVHVLYLESRIIDVEVFMPADRPVSPTEEFEFQPTLSLNNCVATVYRGDLRLLPIIYTKLYHLAKDANLEVVQPFYNVFNENSKNFLGTGDSVVSVYVVTSQTPGAKRRIKFRIKEMVR